MHEDDETYLSLRKWVLEITQFFVLNTTAFKISLGQSETGEIKRIDATAPELGPIVIWSQKSSTVSGSDSNIGKKFTK